LTNVYEQLRKGYSDSAYRMTDNTMVKRKRIKVQRLIHRTIHRKS